MARLFGCLIAAAAIASISAQAQETDRPHAGRQHRDARGTPADDRKIQTVEWIYADPAALKIYADWLGISLDKARRSRDGFFPKQGVDPDQIVGPDQIVKDAVALKYTAAPLTKEQLAEMIHIPKR